jgi:hypothetical protein
MKKATPLQIRAWKANRVRIRAYLWDVYEKRLQKNHHNRQDFGSITNGSGLGR